MSSTSAAIVATWCAERRRHLTWRAAGAAYSQEIGGILRGLPVSSPAWHGACSSNSQRPRLSGPFPFSSLEEPMLHWAAVFLVIALVAALFGFGGIAAGAASIAKVLFVLFIILALVAFIVGRRAPI